MGEVKNILITGGSSGIGKAIVEKFASYDENNVFFTYRSNRAAADMITDRFNNTFSIKCDITNPGDVDGLLDGIKQREAPINVLINNAGIAQDSSFLKMTPEQWNSVLNTNLISIFSLTQVIVALMISNGFGRVINMSSVAGQSGVYGKVNYSASKAGIIGFTKALALETARKGVTVNAIAPGLIETDLIRTIPEHHLTNYLQEIPMKRLGRPEEVAELAFFLASDNASYITGQVVGINGGLYL